MYLELGSNQSLNGKKSRKVWQNRFFLQMGLAQKNNLVALCATFCWPNKTVLMA